MSTMTKTITQDQKDSDKEIDSSIYRMLVDPITSIIITILKSTTEYLTT